MLLLGGYEVLLIREMLSTSMTPTTSVAALNYKKQQGLTRNLKHAWSLQYYGFRVNSLKVQGLLGTGLLLAFRRIFGLRASLIEGASGFLF